MNNHEKIPAQRIYEIRFRGHLDESYKRWFEGLEMTSLPGGDTLLCGPLMDQPALYGVLNRINDLGLELISVRQL